MAWSKLSRHERGYGTAHDKARKQLLAQEPMCRECMAKGIVTVATIADHVISKAKGGAPGIENMQPLCKPCHDEKTAKESAEAQGKVYRPRQTTGVDGWPA